MKVQELKISKNQLRVLTDSAKFCNMHQAWINFLMGKTKEKILIALHCVYGPFCSCSIFYIIFAKQQNILSVGKYRVVQPTSAQKNPVYSHQANVFALYAYIVHFYQYSVICNLCAMNSHLELTKTEIFVLSTRFHFH